MADPNMSFDLNLKDADLHEALNDFFRQAGRAFLLEDDPGGLISVRAADLNFQDALTMLLPDDFDFYEQHGIYHIRRNPQVSQEKRRKAA